MLAAPVSSWSGWLQTRGVQAPQTLDKERTTLLLRACLTLKGNGLLAIGTRGRSLRLSQTELLGRLRELRSDACAEAWRLALEAEYPHLDRRSLNEAFRHPHPVVMGLMAAWAVDALGNRPTLRDRVAQAGMTPSMDKAERVARLWAVRVLGNGCNRALSPQHVTAAAQKIAPHIAAIFRDPHGSLPVRATAALRHTLETLAREAPDWRPEPADASELFEPRPAIGLCAGNMRLNEGIFRQPSIGLRGSVFRPPTQIPAREPPLRLPRSTAHTVLERMHACREAVGPVWAKLPPASALPFGALRDAAKHTLSLAPSPREWSDGRWLYEHRSGDEVAAPFHLPFMQGFGLHHVFGSMSGSTTTMSSDSMASIEDDWQLLDGIDD